MRIRFGKIPSKIKHEKLIHRLEDNNKWIKEKLEETELRSRVDELIKRKENKKKQN